jgi:uncharacterized protein (DUF1810 family)
MNPPRQTEPGTDPFNLRRFVEAQAGCYDTALAELRAGQKESHWMWFVFPQFAGLGLSDMSRRYAIRSEAEAAAYLAHPILGPRLIECCRALLAVPDRTAREILGSPDDAKLASSMTLFASGPGASAEFRSVLERFHGGRMDPRTLALLRSGV